MASKRLDFSMRRGDTPTVEGELRDENNALVDDATSEWKLTARAGPLFTDAEVFSVTSPTQHSPGKGRCAIPISATSGFTYTRVLWYDMQVVETNGNVTTVLDGRITVYADQAR